VLLFPASLVESSGGQARRRRRRRACFVDRVSELGQRRHERRFSPTGSFFLALSLSLSHLSRRRKNGAVSGFRETKLQESSLFSLSRSRPPLEKNTYLICTTSSRPAMGATGLPATRDCIGMSVDLETEAKNGAAREVRDRETNRRLKRNDSLLSLSLSLSILASRPRPFAGANTPAQSARRV
jgi:hypothetical protein